MPTLPARLATGAERWFGRPATVTAVEDLTPGLRRVTFAVPALRGRSWTPGQEIEVRVAERDFRHYTPIGFDPDTGALAVVFALHSGGPGTAWARELATGDRTAVMGPAGGLRRRGGQRELFLGDATALGLFASLLPSAGEAFGAVEVPAPDGAGAAALVPGLDVLPARAEPGAALDRWLGDRIGVVPDAAQRACLVGHAQSIQRHRAALRAAGLARGAVTVKPYWATGKRGL